MATPWEEYVEAGKVNDQKWREQEKAFKTWEAARVAYDAAHAAWQASSEQLQEKRDALKIAPKEAFRGKAIAV